MSFSKNLSGIIGILGLRGKDAADKIGISYNTLSNILNDKVQPSAETYEKIKKFVEENGFSEEDLKRESEIIQNVRIRISDKLSGIEKAAVRRLIENVININSFLESNLHTDEFIDFFDIWTLPYENYDLFSWFERRIEFLNLLKDKKNLKDPKIAADFLHSKKISDLFGFTGSLVYLLPPISEVAISITSTLGIKLFFLHFGTKKIESFSTSLETPKYINPNIIRADSSIFINLDVCKNYENAIFVLAKELYFILFCNYDYETMTDLCIKKEDKKRQSEKFAEYLLVNTIMLKNYITSKVNFFDRYLTRSGGDYYMNETTWCYIIDDIKGHFGVSYKLIIKKLFEIKEEYSKCFSSIEEAEEFYLTSKKKSNSEISNPQPIVDGEPDSHNMNFLFNHHDFMRFSVKCWKNEMENSEELKKEFEKHKKFIEENFDYPQENVLKNYSLNDK